MFQTFRVGNFGEDVAKDVLGEKGFSDVRSNRRGQPGWDIEAKDPEGRPLAISVKARNKLTNKAKPNSIYYLFDSAKEREAKVAFAAENGFEFRWLTVQIDVVRTQNIKFGIPVSEDGAMIGTLLAKDRFDPRICAEMSNI